MAPSIQDAIYYNKRQCICISDRPNFIIGRVYWFIGVSDINRAQLLGENTPLTRDFYIMMDRYGNVICSIGEEAFNKSFRDIGKNLRKLD